MKICSIPDCGGEILAKGFCRKHYLRQYKYGDPYFVQSSSDHVQRGEDSPNFKHGLWNHPLYKTWSNMMRRCYAANDPAFPRYGGRGIDVCASWHDVRKFVADMETRPQFCSIDRIDNDKGYSPENCRWATNSTQSRNRRFAKLNEEKAKEMRALRVQGAKRKELAATFGVSEATVKKVLSGAYWKDGAEKIVPTIAEAVKR